MSRLLLGRGASPEPTPEPLRPEASVQPTSEQDAQPVAADARPQQRPVQARIRIPGIFVFALCLYIFADFVRPQVLAALKLQLIIILFLPAFVAFGKLRWWAPLMTFWVLIFCATAIQVPMASNNYAAYMFTRSVYASAAIALCIAWILQDYKSFRLAFASWVLWLGYVAFYGATHGGVGPSGFTGDENDMALACCVALPAAFFGFERNRGLLRLISAGLMALFLVAIVVSFSRGGFVGLAGVGLFCFYFSRYKVRNLLLGVLMIAIFFVAAPREYIDEIESIQNTEEGTAETRQFLWSAGFNMWKSHPILGVGGGGSNFLIGRYQPEGEEYSGREYTERNWSGNALHSAYVQLLAEFGLVGVFLYSGMVILHFRAMSRLRRDVAARLPARHPLVNQVEMYAGGLSGAMVGFLVPALFLSVVGYPYIWYISGFGLALDHVMRARLEQETFEFAG